MVWGMIFYCVLCLTSSILVGSPHFAEIPVSVEPGKESTYLFELREDG